MRKTDPTTEECPYADGWFSVHGNQVVVNALIGAIPSIMNVLLEIGRAHV